MSNEGQPAKEVRPRFVPKETLRKSLNGILPTSRISSLRDLMVIHGGAYTCINVTALQELGFTHIHQLLKNSVVIRQVRSRGDNAGKAFSGSDSNGTYGPDLFVKGENGKLMYVRSMSTGIDLMQLILKNANNIGRGVEELEMTVSRFKSCQESGLLVKPVIKKSAN